MAALVREIPARTPVGLGYPQPPSPEILAAVIEELDANYPLQEREDAWSTFYAHGLIDFFGQ